MIAINQTVNQTCRQFLEYYFTKFPNLYLQVHADRILKVLMERQSPMPGKSGGWAGGIIYALANLGQRPCGVPGLLNKDLEKFFDTSMGAIYKRAEKIRVLYFSLLTSDLLESSGL